MDITEAEALIKDRRKKIDQDIAMRSALEQSIEDREEDLRAAMEESAVFEKAAMLLNTLGEEKQAEAQSMIEGLVTRGLQEIFEPNISLVISTTVKAKTTSTEFLVRTELEDGSSFETSVMDARGGGLVAVVAFLLRVTVLMLTAREDRRFMLLDETFAHVSEQYLEPLGAFLRTLVEETGLQIVLVTHQPTLAEFATSSATFGQRDGRTFMLDD